MEGFARRRSAGCRVCPPCPLAAGPRSGTGGRSRPSLDRHRTHAESAALAAAKAADLILIPTRPGILDLRAIGTTADLVKLVQKPAFVVLNAVPPRASNV